MPNLFCENAAARLDCFELFGCKMVAFSHLKIKF